MGIGKAHRYDFFARWAAELEAGGPHTTCRGSKGWPAMRNANTIARLEDAPTLEGNFHGKSAM